MFCLIGLFLNEKVIAEKLDTKFNFLNFLKFPFISHAMNMAMKLDFIILIYKFYSKVNSNIIFTINHTIQNFFRFKDIIPEVVKSNVVYIFICAQ